MERYGAHPAVSRAQGAYEYLSYHSAAKLKRFLHFARHREHSCSQSVRGLVAFVRRESRR